MVSSNVGGVNEEKRIVKNVHADDWTAELATIASNATHEFVDGYIENHISLVWGSLGFYRFLFAKVSLYCSG